MNDILILGIFLIAFGGLMVWIYRVLGEDSKKVHGCQAGGMILKNKDDDDKTEVA